MSPPIETINDRFSANVLEILRPATLWIGLLILAFSFVDPFILGSDRDSLPPITEDEPPFELSPAGVSAVAIAVAVGLIAISVWLRKWPPPDRSAHGIAFMGALLGLVRVLSYLVASPSPFRAELLAILLIIAGSVFLSMYWYGAFATIATAIWFSVAYAVRPNEAWSHTTLVVTSAITIGAAMLVVRRKSVLTDVIAARLDEQIHEGLRARVRLGDIRSKIASRLLAVTADDFEQAVEQTLHDVGTTLRADHAFVCRLSSNPLRTTVIYEWATPECSPKLAQIQNVPIDHQKWFVNQIFSGNVVCVPDVGALPPEAFEERSALERLDTGAFLAVPLISDHDAPWGYWGVVCEHRACSWSTDEIDFLNVIGTSLLSTYERVETEAELRRSEFRFRRLFDANIIPVFFADLHGNITEANSAFLDLTGYTREEFPLRWDQLTPAEWKAHDEAAVLRLLRSGIDLPWEKEFFHKSGRRIPIVIGGAVLSYERGECVAFILDLTEAKEAEKKIQHLNAELGRTSRLSVMGEVAAGVAHEVHQPLAAITNYANGARHRLNAGRLSNDQLIEVLTEITKLSDQAGSVIRNIRAFVKGKQSARQQVCVNDVVRDCFQFVRFDIAQRKIDVQSSLADNLPPVMADQSQIMQVLLNVVLNAAHALEKVAEPRRLEITTQRGLDGTVELRVTDNGPGVDGELRERLFEQFATTKEGGLGLGLPISRSIAEAHGGSLDLERSGPDGTTFLLTLPAAD